MNQTIVDLLQIRAKTTPDQVAYRFLEDGESKEIFITYGELHARARHIASKLLASSPAEHRLALLLFPSGLEFIAAFFGCLYAGIIAVPVPIPKKIRSSDRFQNILSDTKASYFLTDSHSYKELQKIDALPIEHNYQWIVTDQTGPMPSTDLCLEPVDIHKTAFLQYTSGSTSAPKGVMISHKNIMANQEMIKNAFGHDGTTIIVGWLPLFHDLELGKRAAAYVSWRPLDHPVSRCLFTKA